MNIERIKKMIYRYLVDSNILISQSFKDYLETAQIEQHYMKKLFKLFQLNWRYRICRQKSLEQKLSKLSMPEWKAGERLSVEEVVRQAEKFDIVSFDIFDTLIFRAVEKPKDVFRILEAKWNIFDFVKFRIEAERKAREKEPEITIYDIYNILETELALDKKKGVRLELETELAVCYANPYMKEVFLKLQKMGKKIIAVSDMYIPQEIMQAILKKCGYEGLEHVYISCDIKLSKRDGRLQKYVQNKEGETLKYIHIGDNIKSDIVGSRLAGWETVYYRNVNEIGYPYRRIEMRTISSAFYKGLVNGKLHSGRYQENEFYEYGYVYGGSMAVGYCQYLKELAKTHNIDQFLFVARDGYIIHKIYKEYDESVDCNYVPFSRFASYQITMERNWKNFLKLIVNPRIQAIPQETMGQVMKICDMMYLEPYLKRYGLSIDTIFNYETYCKVRKIFEDNISEIISNYENTTMAAEKYFRRVIGSHKTVCVVDIGWQGTGALCLKYFLEEKCGMEIQVCGALMGMTNSKASDIYLSNRNLYSYMFSQQKNRDVMLRHTAKNNEFDFRNLLVEILFTEDKPSFIKYQLGNEGEIELIYGQEEHNEEILRDIQRGIYDFAKDYFTYERKFGNILIMSGLEVYMPVEALAEAGKYCLHFLGKYKVNENSGIFEKENTRTFWRVVRENR